MQRSKPNEMVTIGILKGFKDIQEARNANVCTSLITIQSYFNPNISFPDCSWKVYQFNIRKGIVENVQTLQVGILPPQNLNPSLKGIVKISNMEMPRTKLYFLPSLKTTFL